MTAGHYEDDSDEAAIANASDDDLTVVYRTYTEGKLHYSGPDLQEAIRTWDATTFAEGRTVPGGVAVSTYEDLGGPRQLQLRDGWILHVHEDGTVFLNPSIKEG
jgi:hypothetical protein